ncbi:site-specific integrase [Microbacterium wangchenii]|uniref:site-specific integrase n=1 Tax=Microbacterium wangchenii TaxID=2541726 RepID=UPI0021C3C0CE|nr:site-specific integrase [Microbacterium wangchenii]
MRYLVRYRKPDGSQGNRRGFHTKVEAQHFLAEVSVSISKKAFVDPADSRVTIGELAESWLLDQTAVLKPSSMHALRSAWRTHVGPRWAEVRLDAVRYSDIRAWVTDIAGRRKATTTIRAYGVLAAILDVAVRDRRLADNPARGIKLPRKTPKRRVYLTHSQVDLLANQALHPTLVYFLAYTGLRWGEATGLRVADVNLGRRRVNVQENAVMVNGAVVTGTPKTHATRSVPYPEFLEDLIRLQLRLKRPEHLLFGNGSEPQRLPNSLDGWFAAAVRRAMRVDPTFPRITPHDLRHTAASLAISAGANVKAVQRMLGHASAAMTLDTYADLFDDDLDYVAQALTSARHAAVVVVQEQQERGAPTRPSAILPPMRSPGSPGDAARGL